MKNETAPEGMANLDYAVRRRMSVLCGCGGSYGLWAALQAEPELRPFFRELGNQYLERQVDFLLGYNWGALSEEGSNAAIERECHHLRMALEYGTNPYFPTDILSKIMGRALVESQGNPHSHLWKLSLHLLRMGVQMELTTPHQQFLLLTSAGVLQVLLENGMPWPGLFTREIATGCYLAPHIKLAIIQIPLIRTAIYHEQTLRMLCRTDRIYTIPRLLEAICFPPADPFSKYRECLPRLLLNMRILLEERVIMPGTWVDGITIRGRFLRWVIRETCENCARFPPICYPDNYFRACMLLDCATGIGLGLRRLLMAYLLAPYHPYTRYLRSKRR